MILTKTPFRVSLFGGGSDLAAYYSQNIGAVLSFTINKYMYISSHHFFEKNMIRLKYSRTETVKNPTQIEHPILREGLLKFQFKGGIEISSIADIPSGTGMGSSSCFTVGLLQNLYARQHQFISKQRLAEEACTLEIEKLGEPIGKQDQYAASFGGINIFSFHKNGFVEVEKINLPMNQFFKLQNHLHLFYTGTTRSASSVLTEQKSNMKDESKIQIMKKMVESVFIARDCLYKGQIKELGQLLHENWLYKKQMASNISNPEIDEVYEKGIQHGGAWGGKILGAGGGGFLLFVASPENREKLQQAIGLERFEFKVEQEGSKVIYFDEDSVETI